MTDAGEVLTKSDATMVADVAFEKRRIGCPERILGAARGWRTERCWPGFSLVAVAAITSSRDDGPD